MPRYSCQRCDWAPDPDGEPRTDLQEHAWDSLHPVCVCCGRSLRHEEPQTCTECLSRARRDLARIVVLYALLPAHLGQLTARPVGEGKPRRGDPPLQGGDLLALAGPGSDGGQDALWRAGADGTYASTGQSANVPWRPVQHVRNATPDRPTTPAQPNDNWPGDPPSVAFELGRWEDTLRQAKGEPAADTDPTVTGAAGYIERRMGWAADRFDAFDSLAADLRGLTWRLEAATSTSDRPQTGAPCIDCGHDLHRTYSGFASPCRHERPTWARLQTGTVVDEDGKETPVFETIRKRDARIDAWESDHEGCDQGGRTDSWSCPRCRREYDDPSYWLAVRQRLTIEAG